jgi:hypothetical protein
MSLVAYKEVRPWAAAIREAVVQRTMPPWHADSPAGKFLNDPRLSQADIATIQAWVKEGAQEGNPNDLPPAPVFSSGWHIKPDVVFTIPETVVKAGNQDDYEYIYVPTHFTEDKWVQAAEVLPGDRRVVHHATVSVVSANKVPAMLADHAKADEGVDRYHYRTGKVLHLRPNVPVLDASWQPQNETAILPKIARREVQVLTGLLEPAPSHISWTSRTHQPATTVLSRLIFDMFYDRATEAVQRRS